MTEYINKDELMKELDHRYKFLVKQEGHLDPYCQGFNEAVEKVFETEAAEVKEVVRGEWIKGGCGRYYICSNCEQISDFDFDYCPHCGTKNEGVR